MTARQQILNYLKDKGWVHKGKLESQFLNWGYEVSNIDRRCRELAKEGKIERRLNDKGHAEYRMKQSMTADQANKFLQSLSIPKQGSLSI